MVQKPPLVKADLVALLFVAALLGMLIPTVFSQDLAVNKEIRNRSVCAANLRGIIQSMNVYGNENNDMYPMLPPSSATTYDPTFKPGVAASAEEAIKTLYKDKTGTNNPYAGLWLLVLRGDVSAKSFLCPSDLLANVPARLQAGAGAPAGYYTNFQDSKNVSYSAAYMWNVENNKPVVAKLWSATIDASLPLMCDVAPYLGKKDAAQAATRPMSSKPDEAVEDDWAVTYPNSQNHFFDGQNVAFGDAHVEWGRTPLVGENNDSIWGVQKSLTDKTETPLEPGLLPHPLIGAWGNYDVVMVPTRTLKGDLK